MRVCWDITVNSNNNGYTNQNVHMKNSSAQQASVRRCHTLPAAKAAAPLVADGRSLGRG